MTESELRAYTSQFSLNLSDRLIPTDVTMTSGFSTIAGSVLVAYINLGVAPEILVTSSVMSIPASIAISKLRIPEVEEPVTRGSVTVDRGAHDEKDAPVCVIYLNDLESLTNARKRPMPSMPSAKAPLSD